MLHQIILLQKYKTIQLFNVPLKIQKYESLALLTIKFQWFQAEHPRATNPTHHLPQKDQETLMSNDHFTINYSTYLITFLLLYMPTSYIPIINHINSTIVGRNSQSSLPIPYPKAIGYTLRKFSIDIQKHTILSSSGMYFQSRSTKRANYVLFS